MTSRTKDARDSFFVADIINIFTIFQD